jgi:hypothetical protein
VLYGHDSILPEPEVNRWVVNIVKASLDCPVRKALR